MKPEPAKLPKPMMRRFQSDIGASEFFSYAGNMVTIEQALSVIGILQPDFIEREGCIFWRANASEYDAEKYPMVGLTKGDDGQLVQCTKPVSIERYRNNISINQFFRKWEGGEQGPVVKVGLSEDEYELCHAFAQQLSVYWFEQLKLCHPKRSFCFEIADDLLDEYGVCMTFWQD